MSRILGRLLLLALLVLALVVAPSAASARPEAPRATLVFAFHPF